MNIINKIDQWNSFENNFRKFCEISYNSKNISDELNELNEKRQKIQQEIIELSKISDECQNCRSRCCSKSNSDHFTIVDYLMRMFSTNPITHYSCPSKQESMIKSLLKRIRNSQNIHKNVIRVPSPKEKCPDYNGDGCRFEAKDRPIRCVLWTCSSYRETLPSDLRKRIGELHRELVSCIEETRQIFHKI
jgi:hypothetical protein